MKIALLLGLFPQYTYSEIVRNSKGVVQYAADALQKSIVEGLGSLGVGLEIINLPYLGSYPLRYTNFYSPSGAFSYVTQTGDIVKGENVKFCNLTGVKMYARYQKTKDTLSKWCEDNEECSKVVVVYAMHTPFLKACMDVKKKYKSSLKIVLVVPDLPEYMGGKENFVLNILRKKNAEILYKLCDSVDAFVLLSKYMTSSLPVSNKKWTVVEGIFNNTKDDVLGNITKSTDLKYVFYSGTLAKRYGVLNLVKAFNLLPDINIGLMICGAGDAEKEILYYCQKDKRIVFKGQLPRAEVLKLQKQSSLLVNPRTPEGEFTKFSFPSKTMEYLASGVPTLLYKLPGIPDEYYEYCFALEQLSIQELANKIQEILEMNSEKLAAIGVRARNFILENKTPRPQCQKIIDLINSL